MNNYPNDNEILKQPGQSNPVSFRALRRNDEDNEVKGFHILYAWAIFYVICTYLFPLFVTVANNMSSNRANEFGEFNASSLILLLPMILLVVNVVITMIFYNYTDRIVFLGCAVIIKYALIPYYILGGLVIAVSILLMFTPVVIMIFVGPAIAFILSVVGYISVLGVVPFSYAYIKKAVAGQKMSKRIGMLFKVSQFLFTIDVIAVMLTTLKERRWYKFTLLTLMLLVLGFVAVFALLFLAIIKSI